MTEEQKLWALIELLVAELRWCSRSADFNEGGTAHEGWVRGPQQALSTYEELRAAKGKP